MEPTACNQDKMLQSLWKASPENIQAILEFPKPHEDLFELAESIPYWWQLANSAPVLAFMVARCWCFDGLPKEGFIERVKRYVLMKRTEICRVMGFPSDKRTLRLLERVWINSEDSTPYLIADLQVFNMLLRWEPSSYEIWKHEKYISDRDIYMVATGCHLSRDCPWTFRKYHFWFSLPKSEWFFRLPLPKRMCLTDLYGHAARHYDRFPVHQHFLKDLTPLFRLRSYQKADTYLREFLVKLDAIEAVFDELHIHPTSWPEPPIDAGELMAPMSSTKELQREGEEMSHCVYSYHSEIAQGDYYAYRMEKPCRCTVGICFSQGSWKIDQIKGVNNTKVDNPEVERLVEEWLANSPNLSVRRSMQRDLLNAISKACGIPLLK